MPSVFIWRDPFILCVDEVLAHLGDVFVPKYLCCGLCGLIVFVVGGLDFIYGRLYPLYKVIVYFITCFSFVDVCPALFQKIGL